MKWTRLLLLACLAHSPSFAQYDSLYMKNGAYHLQRALHKLYRTNHADVVMLGNSITYGANWSELLGRPGVVNRGIGGDNTYGFLHRMDDVVRLKPRMCFVMAGINDLFADIPVDSVVQNYRRIVDTLQQYQIVPVIQSTLFVSPKWRRSAEKNTEVAGLNERLKALARERHLIFLDLNEQLSSAGVLKEEFTYDGVHLAAAGYAIWSAEVEKVLRRNGL